MGWNFTWQTEDDKVKIKALKMRRGKLNVKAMYEWEVIGYNEHLDIKEENNKLSSMRE
jgi:hypothetical protein